jgi:hypothetical protein
MAWPPADHADVEAAVEGLRVGSARSPMPTTTFPGAYAETLPRWAQSQAGQALTSGIPRLAAIHLFADEVVSALSFGTGGAGSAGLTHLWAALCSTAGTVLAVSADSTTAWAGSTMRTFPMVTPYTVTASGVYYVALCAVATTPPQVVMLGLAGTLHQHALPMMGANAASNVGAPPAVGASVGALTNSATLMYAAVS